MSEPDPTSPKPRRKRGCLFALVFVPILLLLCWFGITSEWFLQRVVLPRVAASAEADISADRMTLRPFSRLDLEGVRFRKNDGTLDADIVGVEARYHLLNILRGTVDVSRIALKEPHITLRPAPDAPKKPKEPTEAVETELQLNIGEIVVEGGRFRMETPGEILEVSDFSFSLNNLKTGELADVKAGANIAWTKEEGVGGEADVLEGIWGLESQFRLPSTLIPSELTVESTFEMLVTRGAFAEAGEVSKLTLEATVTPTEIQSARIVFEGLESRTLGSIQLAGPVDPGAGSADLHLVIEEIGAQVLNLAGAAAGLTFGDSMLAADLRLRVSEAGQNLHSTGTLTGRNVSVRNADFVSPVVFFNLEQDVSVDLETSVADVRALSGWVRDLEELELVSLRLSAPTQLRWGGEQPEFDDVDLDLDLAHIDLADWRALLGEEILGGILKSSTRVRVAEQGRDIRVETETLLSALGVEVNGQRMEGFNLEAKGSYRLRDFQGMALEGGVFRLEQNGAPVLSVQSDGSADLKTGALDFAPVVQADLAVLSRLLPMEVEGFSLTRGRLTGRMEAKRADVETPMDVSAQLAVSGLLGRVGELPLDDFGGRLQATARIGEEEIHLSESTLSLQRAAKQVARVSTSASYNLKTETPGDLRVNLEELHLPEIADWLGLDDLQVVSGIVRGTLGGTLGADGVWTLPMDVTVSNFLVRGEHTPADTPAETVVLRGEWGVSETEAVIRELVLSWRDTERAKNQLQFVGHARWANAEAMNLKLDARAESLDVTPWLMMFAAPSPHAAAPGAETPPPPPATGPDVEPEAIRLPLEEAQFTLNIGKLYLEDILGESVEINLSATDRRVDLRPFRFNLNETPIFLAGHVDLGVAGFEYAWETKVDPLDLEPLLVTLAPPLAGRFRGTLEAGAKLEGWGITGPSLRQNLKGDFNALLTEAALDWVELDHMNNEGVRRAKNLVVFLVRAVAPVLAIPPSDLLNPPIHELNVAMTLGEGNLQLTSFRVVNNSFRIRAAGGVTLEDNLDASRIRDIPVVMGLNILVARQARLYRTDRVRDGMVELPPFVKVGGTLGDPDIDVQRRVITGMIVGGVTESGAISDERAQRVLGGLGGILSGEGIPPPRPTPTPVPTPTPPPDGEAVPDPGPVPTPTPTPRPSRTDRFLRELERL
ncbi:MAG: hypothetical protein JJU29_14480 [Verrucomicrobia bacterium]|nr:hypothetical protein [Verrucomicrobiota bacterium]MCH8513309.1 AsmA family protein [Kiritimatiellia bacterium]